MTQSLHHKACKPEQARCIFWILTRSPDKSCQNDKMYRWHQHQYVLSPPLNRRRIRQGGGKKQLQLICHSMHCSGSSGKMLHDNFERGINWICRDKSSSFASCAQERAIMSNIVSIIDIYSAIVACLTTASFLRHNPRENDLQTGNRQMTPLCTANKHVCSLLKMMYILARTIHSEPFFFSIILYKTNT